MTRGLARFQHYDLGAWGLVAGAAACCQPCMLVVGVNLAAVMHSEADARACAAAGECMSGNAGTKSSSSKHNLRHSR